ncbi:hypothetical protein [Streptomyces sp. NRRL S-15]|uniref:hypothetical protein n=1 Tax=Streptomyces sp. NRRL S-15 TaxID=1463886 RepID=UPI0004CA2D0D|nr:hypothetical protein [Streptomyces sp. NRRL S-15]
MTSPQIIAVMALMREIEKPSACYNRAVRRTSQTLTDSPENDAAQARGNAALLEIEQAVRDWVAKHPDPEQSRASNLLADAATEYRVPVPENGGTNLLVRRQALIHGTGWAVSVPGWGGGSAWTAEGWQESVSALSVDRLFCWPDAATAVDEARRALA